MEDAPPTEPQTLEPPEAGAGPDDPEEVSAYALPLLSYRRALSPPPPARPFSVIAQPALPGETAHAKRANHV